MPKISIIISDDTYWRLSGSDESISNIVQKALQYYWKKTTQKKNNQHHNTAPTYGKNQDRNS